MQLIQQLRDAKLEDLTHEQLLELREEIKPFAVRLNRAIQLERNKVRSDLRGRGDAA